MTTIAAAAAAAKRSALANLETRAPGRLRISDFMTTAPHSVGADQTLDTAHFLMRKHRIRHLPVLRAGELVGVVSHRDLLFVETMRDVDPAQVTVQEAMTQGAFAVGPGASLASVATKMAAQRYGCAVVIEDGDVIGIFTTTDSLRAVAALASDETPAVT